VDFLARMYAASKTKQAEEDEEAEKAEQADIQEKIEDA